MKKALRIIGLLLGVCGIVMLGLTGEVHLGILGPVGLVLLLGGSGLALVAAFKEGKPQGDITLPPLR